MVPKDFMKTILARTIEMICEQTIFQRGNKDTCTIPLADGIQGIISIATATN